MGHEILAHAAVDPGASFSKEVELDAAVGPMVTWGTNPEQSLPITAAFPIPPRSRTPSDAPNRQSP